MNNIRPHQNTEGNKITDTCFLRKSSQVSAVMDEDPMNRSQALYFYVRVVLFLIRQIYRSCDIKAALLFSLLQIKCQTICVLCTSCKLFEQQTPNTKCHQTLLKSLEYKLV